MEMTVVSCPQVCRVSSSLPLHKLSHRTQSSMPLNPKHAQRAACFELLQPHPPLGELRHWGLSQQRFRWRRQLGTAIRRSIRNAFPDPFISQDDEFQGWLFLAMEPTASRILRTDPPVRHLILPDALLLLIALRTSIYLHTSLDSFSSSR